MFTKIERRLGWKVTTDDSDQAQLPHIEFAAAEVTLAVVTFALHNNFDVHQDHLKLCLPPHTVARAHTCNAGKSSRIDVLFWRITR
jgi:hypothetical protein